MKTVKESKEVIALVIATANAINDARADGKIDYKDTALILPIIPKIGPAIDNIGEVPAELADLDPTEAAELVAQLQSDLNIGSDEVKQLIGSSLKWIAATVQVLNDVKGLKKPSNEVGA